MTGLRIGVDLGGTKIEVAALDQSGQLLARRRLPTPRHDYRAILATIAELVQGVERELGQSGTVGVSMPGTLSPATGRVKNANSIWLNDQTLDRDLEALLGRPVRFANDADCFALSEATDGAAAGASPVFGVIIGTGTGAGIVIGGRLLQGPNGIAGEWGHNPLPWPAADELPGPDCYCGRQGCLETWLSGPGLERDYRQATGRTLTGVEIAAAAKAGEPAACQALERHEGRLARGLASIINVIDPQVIVLGGGLSNLTRLYERVPELWTQYVFSDRVDTRLVPPRYGDSSGVRGAAWLWP